MPRRNIELQIDELVLDGIPYSQRLRVAAALEGELTRLLSESPAGAELGDRRLELPAFEVSGHPSAEAIGQQVAHSAYQQIAVANLSPCPGQGANA